MEPGLARFESEQPQIKYRHINVDEKDSPENKETFEKYFKGEAIPYTVLINKDGDAVNQWTGAETYDNLLSQIVEFDEKAGAVK